MDTNATTFDAAVFLAGLIEPPLPKAVGLIGQRAAVCQTCRCAIAWATPDGPICAACHPRPQGAVKLVVVDEPDGAVWRDYDGEREAQRARPATDDATVEVIRPGDADPWESADEWTDATPACRKCGTAATWLDALDHVRCQRCDPPRLAERTIATAKGIRRRLGIEHPVKNA